MSTFRKQGFKYGFQGMIFYICSINFWSLWEKNRQYYLFFRQWLFCWLPVLFRIIIRNTGEFALFSALPMFMPSIHMIAFPPLHLMILVLPKVCIWPHPTAKQNRGCFHLSRQIISRFPKDCFRFSDNNKGLFFLVGKSFLIPNILTFISQSLRGEPDRCVHLPFLIFFPFSFRKNKRDIA